MPLLGCSSLSTTAWMVWISGPAVDARVVREPPLLDRIRDPVAGSAVYAQVPTVERPRRVIRDRDYVIDVEPHAASAAALAPVAGERDNGLPQITPSRVRVDLAAGGGGHGIAAFTKAAATCGTIAFPKAHSLPTLAGIRVASG